MHSIIAKVDYGQEMGSSGTSAADTGSLKPGQMDRAIGQEAPYGTSNSHIDRQPIVQYRLSALISSHKTVDLLF